MTDFNLLDAINNLAPDDYIHVFNKASNQEFKITKKNFEKSLALPAAATPQVIRGLPGPIGPAGVKTRAGNLPLAQVLNLNDSILITTYLKDNIERLEVPKFQAEISKFGFGFSYKYIDTNETVVIPWNKEMVVHGDFVNEGNLICDGCLVIED